MILREAFLGKIKTQNKQFIETKFFCIGIIPINPISSMLVTESDGNSRIGIEIMKNKLSILAVILRLLSTIMFLSSGIFYPSGYFEENTMLKVFKVIITLLLAIYFWFFFGKTTKKEKFIRNQFGKIYGLYFMPEWLYLDEFEKFNESAKNLFITRYSSESWSEKLKTSRYNDDDFALFYCLSYFENILHPDKKVKNIIQQKYDECIEMFEIEKRSHNSSFTQ
jgi:hypothetical protein